MDGGEILAHDFSFCHANSNMLGEPFHTSIHTCMNDGTLISLTPQTVKTPTLTVPRPCQRIGACSTLLLLDVERTPSTAHAQCVRLIVALTKAGCSLRLKSTFEERRAKTYLRYTIRRIVRPEE